MDAALWGLIGTVVGALSSIVTTWLSAKSGSAQQEARASTERLHKAMEFQRVTVLELQEALHDALRLLTRAYLEDVASSRAGKPWSEAMLGEQLNEDLRLSFRRVSILVERVSNDSLRQEVKTLMTIAQLALHARSEKDAEFELTRCQNEALRVLELLGYALRATY